MKTKIFLLACLFLGFGITQLSAQLVPPDNKPGTGTVNFNETAEEYPLDLPVVCGGTEINHLIGSMVGFGRVFYRGGNMIFQHSWYKWDFIGNGGESFKGKDIFNWDYSLNTGWGRMNLVGDKGSHYILSYIWGSSGIEIQEITCPGSK